MKSIQWSLTLLVFLSLSGADSICAAEEWGDLSGQFIYSGDPPQPAHLELNKDIEVCSKFEPHSEQLLVHPENRGIANVVIWLEHKRGDAPPIHPDYEKQAKAEVTLANDKCLFSPHVVTLRTGQPLIIHNADPIAHNTAAALRRNLPFNAVSSPNSKDQRTLKRPERKPVKVSCSIHAWMTGWLLVQDHPYMAVTDDEGRFTLKNLPAGEWTFQVWHEIPQEITTAAQDDKTATWKKGSVTVTVKPGKNDFGRWTLDPEMFR